jgi:hypothetical protein
MHVHALSKFLLYIFLLSPAKLAGLRQINIVTCYLLTRRIICWVTDFCVSIYWILHQAEFIIT